MAGRAHSSQDWDRHLWRGGWRAVIGSLFFHGAVVVFALCVPLLFRSPLHLPLAEDAVFFELASLAPEPEAQPEAQPEPEAPAPAPEPPAPERPAPEPEPEPPAPERPVPEPEPEPEAQPPAPKRPAPEPPTPAPERPAPEPEAQPPAPKRPAPVLRDIALREPPPPDESLAGVFETLELEPPAPKEEPEEDPLAAILSDTQSTPVPVQPTPFKARAEDVALIRQTMARTLALCWRLEPGSAGAAQIVVLLRLRLAPDGDVRKVTVVDQGRFGRDPQFRAAAENAQRAVRGCSPYHLPQAQYALWQDMEITFDPQQMFDLR